eukprot:gnl/Chilomastix_cuspidata/4987.p1 GENE.gnl/Chilomastix_cuspidata/4987~~gnl/Chilomastix_cuspidata/4987.p1  ORF type:complete len:1136 (+),score=606.75 gnl/Chilomastix_cuspidata/4987:30-3437(+)
MDAFAEAFIAAAGAMLSAPTDETFRVLNHATGLEDLPRFLQSVFNHPTATPHACIQAVNVITQALRSPVTGIYSSKHLLEVASSMAATYVTSPPDNATLVRTVARMLAKIWSTAFQFTPERLAPVFASLQGAIAGRTAHALTEDARAASRSALVASYIALDLLNDLRGTSFAKSDHIRPFISTILRHALDYFCAAHSVCAAGRAADLAHDPLVPELVQNAVALLEVALAWPWIMQRATAPDAFRPIAHLTADVGAAVISADLAPKVLDVLSVWPRGDNLMRAGLVSLLHHLAVLEVHGTPQGAAPRSLDELLRCHLRSVFLTCCRIVGHGIGELESDEVNSVAFALERLVSVAGSRCLNVVAATAATPGESLLEALDKATRTAFEYRNLQHTAPGGAAPDVQKHYTEACEHLLTTFSILISYVSSAGEAAALGISPLGLMSPSAAAAASPDQLAESIERLRPTLCELCERYFVEFMRYAATWSAEDEDEEYLEDPLPEENSLVLHIGAMGRFAARAIVPKLLSLLNETSAAAAEIHRAERAGEEFEAVSETLWWGWELFAALLWDGDNEPPLRTFVESVEAQPEVIRALITHLIETIVWFPEAGSPAVAESLVKAALSTYELFCVFAENFSGVEQLYSSVLAAPQLEEFRAFYHEGLGASGASFGLQDDFSAALASGAALMVSRFPGEQAVFRQFFAFLARLDKLAFLAHVPAVAPFLNDWLAPEPSCPFVQSAGKRGRKQLVVFAINTLGAAVEEDFCEFVRKVFHALQKVQGGGRRVLLAPHEHSLFEHFFTVLLGVLDAKGASSVLFRGHVTPLQVAAQLGVMCALQPPGTQDQLLGLALRFFGRAVRNCALLLEDAEQTQLVECVNALTSAFTSTLLERCAFAHSSPNDVASALLASQIAHLLDALVMFQSLQIISAEAGDLTSRLAMPIVAILMNVDPHLLALPKLFSAAIGAVDTLLDCVRLEELRRIFMEESAVLKFTRGLISGALRRTRADRQEGIEALSNLVQAFPKNEHALGLLQDELVGFISSGAPGAERSDFARTLMRVCVELPAHEYPTVVSSLLENAVLRCAKAGLRTEVLPEATCAAISQGVATALRGLEGISPRSMQRPFAAVLAALPGVVSAACLSAE